MPELPEVEIVARQLRTLIKGRTFIRAQLRRPKLAPASAPRQFAAWLRGARVDEIGRRGKHLLIHLNNGRTLITHLRMTGRFLYVDGQERAIPHTHAVFWLDNGQKLLFTDQRHFGMMMIVRSEELESCAPLSKLAPEPFSAEFSDEFFYRSLRGSRQPIKQVLLDQTKVAGLGNIYAVEALHRAQINPRRPANRLSLAAAAALRREIIAVLSEAIATGSALKADPRELEGNYVGGACEESWRVYDREGQPCLTCQRPIRRFRQGARSTYYCPRCQRS
jgi:formamidopyrimidine-DNA glycosylase